GRLPGRLQGLPGCGVQPVARCRAQRQHQGRMNTREDAMAEELVPVTPVERSAAPRRRGFVLAAAMAGGAAAGLLPLVGQAAEWPERTLRLVVAFPPGGSTDMAARVLA